MINFNTRLVFKLNAVEMLLPIVRFRIKIACPFLDRQTILNLFTLLLIKLLRIFLNKGDLDNSFQLPSYTRTAVNFRNLFDIDYFETAESDLRVYPGAPFTVVGSVSYKF